MLQWVKKGYGAYCHFITFDWLARRSPKAYIVLASVVGLLVFASMTWYELDFSHSVLDRDGRTQSHSSRLIAGCLYSVGALVAVWIMGFNAKPGPARLPEMTFTWSFKKTKPGKRRK